MVDATPQALVSPSDIAEMTGVSRGAVSNWRKRSKDFPERVAGTAANPLFDRASVVAWLDANGKKTPDQGAKLQVWAALNALRTLMPIDELPQVGLSVACARKLTAEQGGTGGGAWQWIAKHVAEDGFRTFEDAAFLMAEEWEDLVYVTDAMLDAPPIAAEAMVAVFNGLALDSLAEVVDYALGKIASSQIRQGVEHGFVGSRISTLLANITRGRTGTLYDPACGIGAALLEAAEPTDKRMPTLTRVVGHDINQTAITRARQRFYLHGVDADFMVGDVIREDPDPDLLADTIIVEPPYGMRWDGDLLIDPRWQFGRPPKNSTDTAWIQHTIAHLAPGGRGYVITPAKTLFRGASEQTIRTELVHAGCVEAIVSLPGKMLPHISVALAVWVLCRPGESADPDQVLLVDGATFTYPEEHIVQYLAGGTAAARRVPVRDLLASGTNLTPAKWVQEMSVFPEELSAAAVESIRNLSKQIDLVSRSSVQLDLPKVRQAEVTTLGELASEGAVKIWTGRAREQEIHDRVKDRLVKPSAVRAGILPEVGPLSDEPDVLPSGSTLSRPGDVLVTTMHEVRTIVDETGWHLLGSGVYRVGVVSDQLLPEYLAAVLRGGWNQRFQSGSTIQRANLRALEVPLVPLADQSQFVASLSQVAVARDLAKATAAEAQQAYEAMLAALRWNALGAREEEL